MPRFARRRWHWLVLAAAAVIVAATTAAVVLVRRTAPPDLALPLRSLGEIALPGDGSRFDYASLDSDRGLLFIAHLGASQVIEVDVHANRVVRVIDDIDQVHGVLVVPALHRVYATATGVNGLVILDEDTGDRLGQAATGDYPDGLAYDPVHNTIWTTNESGGSETVVNAVTGHVEGNVPLGGDAGNVYYDPVVQLMLADVQSRDELAVIDPAGLTVVRRVALRGCDHDHGLAVDSPHRLAFVACDGNATVLTVDLGTWQVADTQRVGDDPDVLAFDSSAARLYVAAESGTLAVLDERGRRLILVGRSFLADNAHVVAVDPATHRTYYPVPRGHDNHPALLTCEPLPQSVSSTPNST